MSNQASPFTRSVEGRDEVLIQLELLARLYVIAIINEYEDVTS